MREGDVLHAASRKGDTMVYVVLGLAAWEPRAGVSSMWRVMKLVVPREGEARAVETWLSGDYLSTLSREPTW